jgi:sugar phosphate isomerase/epimerase
MSFSLSRRGLLTAGLAAVAAPGLAQAKGGYPWPLGVQLWSVNAEIQQDFDGTLRKLAGLGYQRVESAGLHGHTPEAFRKGVEAVGLRCDSAHVSMPTLQADPAGQIAAVRDMGVDYLICSSPKPPRPLTPGMDWIPAMQEAMTLDAWKRNAEQLNVIGAQAAKAGLKFGYHNHPAEFAVYDGQVGYDLLLAGTDPALVCMELDLAWAAAGGADAIALLKGHPGRFKLLHLKDITVRPTVGKMATDFTTAELGRGVIDWKLVLAAAVAAGVRGAYVEQEAPYVRPVWESLAISRDYLRSL